MVIATTFLSIIGMSVGLLLGAQKDRDQASDDRPAPVVTTTAAVTPTKTTPTKATPSKPVPTPSGKPCRAETQAAAAKAGVTGGLALVQHLRTDRSDVYICRDASGALFYHANNGGDRWVEGETALFLTGVVRGDDDYHVTAHDGATFSVTKKRLFIVHANGGEEVQAAVG